MCKSKEAGKYLDFKIETSWMKINYVKAPGVNQLLKFSGCISIYSATGPV